MSGGEGRGMWGTVLVVCKWRVIRAQRVRNGVHGWGLVRHWQWGAECVQEGTDRCVALCVCHQSEYLGTCTHVCVYVCVWGAGGGG